MKTPSIADVSVIIPSRLGNAPDGSRWVDRAVRSVGEQTVQPCEILLALDVDVLVTMDNVRAVNGPGYGHAQAINAAAQAARGSILAFLEDDDFWMPRRLEYGLYAMQHEKAGFVSCSQLEVEKPACRVLGTMDFPTASGWMLARKTWLELGGLDPRFQIHQDNEFLARVSQAKIPRLHFVDRMDASRAQLQHLARKSRLMETLEGVCLIERSVHGDSILAGCRGNRERAERSQKEYAALEVLYGGVPW